jgi:hypothetical protein
VSALELSEPRIGVITCLAEPDAIEAIASPARALALRVAPDELSVWCQVGERAAVLGALREQARAADPSSLTLDASSGWAARLLSGPGSREAFCSLSPNHPGADGPRFVQGAVRGVPARCVVDAEAALMLFVSTSVIVFDQHRPSGWRLAAAGEDRLAELLEIALVAG